MGRGGRGRIGERESVRNIILEGRLAKKKWDWGRRLHGVHYPHLNTVGTWRLSVCSALVAV